MVDMPQDFSYNYNCIHDVVSALPKEIPEDNELVLMGHSWGGNCVQTVLHANTKFEGWNLSNAVLLQSAIRRDFVSINKKGADNEGKSGIALGSTPILTLGGSMDGLMRMSRFAEDWMHTMYNNATQQYTAMVAKDVTHGGWLSE
jgi:hypothetical protein